MTATRIALSGERAVSGAVFPHNIVGMATPSTGAGLLTRPMSEGGFLNACNFFISVGLLVTSSGFLGLANKSDTLSTPKGVLQYAVRI
jgi:hypothetical protein